MPLYRASLRALGAVALLAAALACGGKKGGSSPAAATTINLSGTVTYARVPLATDANGVPTGLGGQFRRGERPDEARQGRAGAGLSAI